MEKELLTTEKENELAIKVEKGFNALEALNTQSTNLTQDEINYLNGLYQEGIKARDILISSNTNLVYHMAKSYYGKGVDKEDLHQCGLMGLQKAAEGFRVGKDAKFSTYAAWWIRDALGRCVANTGRAIRIPNQVYQNVNKYKGVYASLENELGTIPSPKQIAVKMGIKEAEVLKLMEVSQKVNSLDMFVDEDKENTFADLMADNGALSPLENTIKNKLGAKLYPALRSTLDDREYSIINEYFGLDGNEPKTFEEIGAELNISRERTRQLFNKSLLKLRQSSYASDLKSLMSISE